MEENQVTNGHLTEEVDKVENAEPTMDSEELLLNQEIPRLEEGAIIEGTVVAVDDDEIAVNVGGKSDYTIPLAELTSEKVESAREIVQVGEKIKVMVLKAGDEKTRLSKRKAEEEEAWQQLKEAFEQRQRVSGKIVRAIKGGLAGQHQRSHCLSSCFPCGSGLR